MKNYKFIIYPNRHGFTWESPLSSNVYSSPESASKWAEILLKWNSWAEYCVFKTENGRKEYILKRGQSFKK
jgi:hypothetical protein